MYKKIVRVKLLQENFFENVNSVRFCAPSVICSLVFFANADTFHKPL